MKKVRKDHFNICIGILIIISLLLVLPRKILNKNKMEQISEISYIDVDSKEFKDSIMEAHKEKYGENYKEIIEKNAQAAELASKLDLEYKNIKTGEIQYPSNFGGEYINDDNELVVQIVRNSKYNNILKKNISNISSEIKYEYVSNSYSDLERVNDQISKILLNNNIVNNRIKAYYIDITNNAVTVELQNNTEEEQAWFKANIIDSNLILFAKSKSDVIETKVYNAGSKSPYEGSLAFRAKLNGVNGVVTAAHVTSLNQEISGLGKVIARSYKPLSGVDVAFIQFYSGNSATNNLEWGYSPVTSIVGDNTNARSLVGTIIAKSGHATKATSGKITVSSYNYVEDNKNGTCSQYIDYVLTDAQCNHGDSGGVVYKISSGSTSGIVLGITTAKTDYGPYVISPGKLIYSKIANISNELGFVRY